MLEPSRFVFLNRAVEVPAGNWKAQSESRLWRYNLHYFDDLTAVDAGARREWHLDLVDHWIEANPCGQGDGWEPYPTSLRIVNWIKFALAGAPLSSRVLASLAAQTQWLSGRIEWHLMANHLVANAKALIFAGTFFDGANTRAWWERGLQLLESQLREQILEDGGHFERSPMYHGLILEDLLDLLNLAGAFPGVFAQDVVSAWTMIAGRMTDWHEVMVHPDGEITFFNDAAVGIAARPVDLASYARRLGISRSRAARAVEVLQQTGYIRVDRGPAVAFLDVAPVGPDYQPGHAHADTLSFELSLFDQRLLVNGGTSLYEVGAERLRQRGTAAHNTVLVDGLDSSEVWSAFRVARRASPVDLSIEEDADTVKIACSHDGYRRLAGDVIHRRQWHFSPGSLEVVDNLIGRFNSAQAMFLLHPAVRVVACSEHGAMLDRDGHGVRLSVTGGNMRAIASTWHPEFGISMPTTTLEVDFERPNLHVMFDYSSDRS
jgi:uncharacterized heparinase superfamily protein